MDSQKQNLESWVFSNVNYFEQLEKWSELDENAGQSCSKQDNFLFQYCINYINYSMIVIKI